MIPSIPLQFVCALFLIVFFVRLLRRDEGPPNRFFMAMLVVLIAQSILHGLRWGYGVTTFFWPLQPILAAIAPPLTWIGFSTLTTSGAATRPWRRLWPHLLPPVAVALLLFAPRDLPFLPAARLAIAVGYGIPLIRLGYAGSDALDRVQLDGAISVRRALLGAGLTTIGEGLVDLAITIDIVFNRGAHSAWIAGGATLLFIVVLSYAVVTAGESVSAADDPAAPEPAASATSAGPEPEDGQVMATLDSLMASRAFYRDPELSLDRLARKVMIPTRRISAAVNRVRDMNVSQYVNGYRIDEARRRLAETDEPITQIMLEVGFQTKSNFNREFLRVTGKSPSAWRSENKAARAVEA